MCLVFFGGGGLYRVAVFKIVCGGSIILVRPPPPHIHTSKAKRHPLTEIVVVGRTREVREDRGQEQLGGDVQIRVDKPVLG